MHEIEVANGAAEVSTAVDTSVYGMTTVLAYGFHAMDTYTSTVPHYINIAGTTITVYNSDGTELYTYTTTTTNSPTARASDR